MPAKSSLKQRKKAAPAKNLASSGKPVATQMPATEDLHVTAFGNYHYAASPLQRRAAAEAPAQQQPQAKSNNTGLPDNLKSGIEKLSGLSLDNVKVHYNSQKSAELNALAYAQGTDIHVAPGQEQHLPHEAWHVVQQAQGRVKPTIQMKGGVQINDDGGLEREADLMGGKATQMMPEQKASHNSIAPIAQAQQIGQSQTIVNNHSAKRTQRTGKIEDIDNGSATGIDLQKPNSKCKIVQKTKDDAEIFRATYEEIIYHDTYKEAAKLLGLPKQSNRKIQYIISKYNEIPDKLDKSTFKELIIKSMKSLAEDIDITIVETAFNKVYEKHARRKEKKKVVRSDYIPNKRFKHDLPIPIQDEMTYLDSEQKTKLQNMLEKPKVVRKIMNAGFSVHSKIIEENSDIGALIDESEKDLSQTKLTQEATIAALDYFSKMKGADKRGLKIGLGLENQQATFGQGGMMIPGLGTYAQEKQKIDKLIEDYDIKDISLFEYAITNADIEIIKNLCNGITDQKIGWLLRLGKLHVLELYRSKPLMSAVSAHHKLAMFGEYSSHSEYMGSSPMEPSNATSNLVDMKPHELKPKQPDLWESQQESFKKGLIGVGNVDMRKSQIYDPSILPFYESLFNANESDSEPEEEVIKSLKNYIKSDHMEGFEFGSDGSNKISGELGLPPEILNSVKEFPNIKNYITNGIFVVKGNEWTCYIRCILFSFGKIGKYTEVINKIKTNGLDITSGVIIPSTEENNIRTIIKNVAAVGDFYVEATDVSHGGQVSSETTTGTKIKLILTGAHYSLLLN